MKKKELDTLEAALEDNLHALQRDNGCTDPNLWGQRNQRYVKALAILNKYKLLVQSKNEVFVGRFLMRKTKDRNDVPCVVIAGVGFCDKERIEAMNDCDEMWVGEVEMKAVVKMKDLRSMSGAANHMSVHDFLKGANWSERAWMKMEKDGVDIPNEKYMHLDDE